MLRNAAQNSRPCRLLWWNSLCGILLLACIALVAPPATAQAANAVACVSIVTPSCKEGSLIPAAFQWGVQTLEGGGRLRGIARADARSLGVNFFSKAEFGSTALANGSANAAFFDNQVQVQTAGSVVATLIFAVGMTGGFSGSDHGPPCDHCGGESPWVASGTAIGTMQVTDLEGSESATFATAWTSNAGVTDELEGPAILEVAVLIGETFSWSSAMTVNSTAGNPSCLSGAGTCGVPGGAEANGDFRSTFRFHDFHLYDAETHEEIFDFTLTGSNGIDYLAIDRGCGNGSADEGEECDDGNVDPGDCCSPGCKLETGACDDRDACTADGVCDGASCVGAQRFSCPLPCGDADGSGQLSAVDALVALRTAVGSSQCDDCRCNATTDEEVTTVDALKILQAAVGIAVVLDCRECVPDF